MFAAALGLLRRGLVGSGPRLNGFPATSVVFAIALPVTRKLIVGDRRYVSTRIGRVEITTAGIDKATSHPNMTREQFEAVMSVRELLQSAVPVSSSPDSRSRPNIKLIHTLEAAARIGGEVRPVTIIVREMTDGKRYYDQHVLGKREAPASDVDVDSPGAGSTGRPLTGASPTTIDGPAAEIKGNAADAEPDGEILAQNRGLSPIALKNASVDAEREARGLPPLMSEGRRSNPIAWDAAMKRMESDPTWQDRLVAELSAEPRPPTQDESMALLHRQITMRNNWHDAMEAWQAAMESGDQAAIADARARLDSESVNRDNFDELDRQLGTESGRSLAARKQMAEEDYSLAAMTMEAEQTKDRLLTDAERQQVVDQNKKSVERQKKFDEHEVISEVVNETKAVNEAMREASRPAPHSPGRRAGKAPNPEAELETAIAAIKGKVDKQEIAELTPFVQRLARRAGAAHSWLDPRADAAGVQRLRRLSAVVER